MNLEELLDGDCKIILPRGSGQTLGTICFFTETEILLLCLKSMGFAGTRLSGLDPLYSSVEIRHDCTKYEPLIPSGYPLNTKPNASPG
ncbi:hypothetical protein Y1Q_0018574 [Alligator mississippiensis]|uniref:Uncharacterized protein n=1 Tax=Alligator mississippiensis TaxID=8496 RepID=A0A151PGQ1_ALLMI|nr:hypothetical protein Y1Q_0018574 [Alligator mississippiensis]